MLDIVWPNAKHNRKAAPKNDGKNTSSSRSWNVCLLFYTRVPTATRQRYRHHNSLILGFQVQSRPQNAFIASLALLVFYETIRRCPYATRLLSPPSENHFFAFVGHIMMMQRNLASNVVFIRMSDNVKSNIEGKFSFLLLFSSRHCSRNVDNQTCIAPSYSRAFGPKNRHDMARNLFRGFSLSI